MIDNIASSTSTRNRNFRCLSGSATIVITLLLRTPGTTFAILPLDTIDRWSMYLLKSTVDVRLILQANTGWRK